MIQGKLLKLWVKESYDAHRNKNKDECRVNVNNNSRQKKERHLKGLQKIVNLKSYFSKICFKNKAGEKTWDMYKFETICHP